MCRDTKVKCKNKIFSRAQCVTTHTKCTLPMIISTGSRFIGYIKVASINALHMILSSTIATQ